MPLKSKRKIKQCDPFFKGEVLQDNTSRNKVFKEKKSNAIPKSLRVLMEGKELVKQIENKRKVREQQEKKVQKQNSTISTTTTTTTTSTTESQSNNNDNSNNNNNNSNNKINKKVQKENIKELDNINLDIKEDLKKLNSLYYQKAKEDIPEGVKEEDDILKTNLKKHKGEDHRDYLARINKEIAIKMKKNSSTYQKRKEFFEEKKLKEKLKKQGIRYSDYLEQLKREEEKKKEEEEEAAGIHKRKKRRTDIEDFDELKDNIKFNEQIERPPIELPKLKDFTSKKQMQSTDSSKRSYLWQNDIGSSNKNNQLLSSKQLQEEERKRKQSTNQQQQQQNKKSNKSASEFDEEKELLKRNLEIFKQKTLDNYKQSKNRKQQLNKINKEKEKEENNNNNSNNSSKLNKQFYL